MKKTTPLTFENFEKLLDRKLEEKLEQKLEEKLDQKLDEKLKPIKDDIGGLKNDVALIKQVTEKMNDRMNKGFNILNQKIERLEEINIAHIEDYDGHELRIKRLEKGAGVTNN